MNDEKKRSNCHNGLISPPSILSFIWFLFSPYRSLSFPFSLFPAQRSITSHSHCLYLSLFSRLRLFFQLQICIFSDKSNKILVYTFNWSHIQYLGSLTYNSTSIFQQLFFLYFSISFHSKKMIRTKLHKHFSFGSKPQTNSS